MNGEEPQMPKVDATLKEESVPTHRIKPLYRAKQIIYYLLGLIEVLLILRFLLKLFGANAAAGFTAFIYTVSGVFAKPFLFVFGISQAQGSVFEWSTLLAMAVYALVAWLIVRGLIMIRPMTTEEAERRLPEE